jgi:hypothetical protein
MKVLHAPLNYGSLASHSVRCLRQANVDARGLVFSASFVQSADAIEIIREDYSTRSRRIATRLRQMVALIKYLVFFRPDIVHWYFGSHAVPYHLDVWLIKLLRIPRLVEWQGSDIRDPSFEAADNRYYAEAWNEGYEYRDFENVEDAQRRQAEFAAAGFACAAPVGMVQYVKRDIFPDIFIIPQRFVLSDYAAAYPDVHNDVPLIVHSPSAPVAKGTKAVLSAIEILKKNYRFEFQLIQGMPRAEALKWMQQADIFLDQFVLGDRGMAALEAMALGKPVVCYIKPSLETLYRDQPIINSTQEALPEVLGQLIENPQLRYEMGVRSRAYIEATYESAKLSDALIDMYQTVISQFHKK